MPQKYIQAPRRARRRVSITSFGQGMDAASDEHVLPPHIASEIYNFDFSSGALIEGYGLKSVPYITRQIDSMWTYRRYDFEREIDEEILMYASSGIIFYQRGGIEHRLEGITFTGRVRAINYRLYGDDVILMTSPTDHMAVWDGMNDAYTVPNSPHITSMTIHFERMFSSVGGERNAVWFSRDLDPTNWDLELDRGGFIQMLDERGKVNKVISYLNFVYILRDFGISRLSAFADQTDFSVTNLFVSSGRIFEHTAALCGDRIIFLASDGLYQFDGLTTSRIMQRLDGAIDVSPNAAASFHNGKYYLSCIIGSADTADNKNNNAVLVYEVATGLFSILKDVDVRAFNKCNEKMYAITENGTAAYIERCGSVFGEITTKRWVSGLLDFGTDTVKHVREINFATDDAVTLTVFTESTSKDFTITPDRGIARVRVNLSGRKIGIAIVSKTEQARVARPTVVIS